MGAAPLLFFSARTSLFAARSCATGEAGNGLSVGGSRDGTATSADIGSGRASGCFAPTEAYRARWRGRDYAELAWLLLGHDGPYAGGHLAVIGAARAHQGMQDIAANLPAGQVSLIEDASMSVRASLLRRATLCVGTERLTARMAWVAATRHIVRLDARDEDVSAPYELHAGNDVGALADFLAEMRVKSTTNTFSFANQR